MARTKRHYRQTYRKTSSVAGLQYDQLLELIEREGLTLSRRSDKVLQQLSTTLERNLVEAHSALKRVSIESSLVDPATRLVLAEERLHSLQAEVNRRYRARPWPWRVLFPGIPPELRQELRQAEAAWRSESATWQMRQFRHNNAVSTMRSTPFKSDEQARRFIARAQAARVTLQEAWLGEARRAELERMERDRAQAEAYRNGIRSGAVAVRKSLRRNHPCPYCGGPLGDDAQADHIHPVSQGGQSTKNNMVYVCYKCNQAKSDKTLREFILTQGFNRDVVEQRLSKLGKRF